LPRLPSDGGTYGEHDQSRGRPNVAGVSLRLRKNNVDNESHCKITASVPRVFERFRRKKKPTAGPMEMQRLGLDGLSRHQFCPGPLVAGLWREIGVDCMRDKDGDAKHTQDYHNHFNHFDAPY
jgi:hypothetical protein